MKNVFHILLLLILAQTTAFAQVDSTAYAPALADSIVVDNTIKETIKLDDVTFETIEREGSRYYAVTSDGHKEEITSMIDGKTRALVKDDSGHELVIDKDGNVMGVEEYKACGGSDLLLKQYNAEKDSLMATMGNVTFDKVEGEEYGFDKWRGENYDKEQYPTITDHNEYRPSYMGIEKGNEVKVKASRTKGMTFKNERGVPLIADKDNNTLTFNAGTTAQQAIYAYEDTTVVGKLDVQAYSYKGVKVHLVRVNNTKTLDLGKIEKEVNDIWQQAVVRYTFDELEPITIDYANKEHFVHGGKGTFQNHNADQKTAIKALPEGVDGNDYYLFFVDCYDRLDTAGMKSNEPVSGYMPVGRHYGFIYNEFNNTRTIAHELGHGTNVLHHTFSDDSESFHTTAKTDNLMDYNGGTALNHKQWQWSHEKHRNVLGFLDGEGESEMIATADKDSISLSITKLNDAFAPGVGELEIEYTLDERTQRIIAKYPNENFEVILVVADSLGNIVHTTKQKADNNSSLIWNGYTDKEQMQPILFKDGPYKVSVSLVGGKKYGWLDVLGSWSDFKDKLYQETHNDSLMCISTSVDTSFNIINDPVKLDYIAYKDEFKLKNNEEWYADFVESCKANGYFTDSLAIPMEWLIMKGVKNTSVMFCGQTVSGILPELAEMIKLADDYLKDNYPDLHDRYTRERKYEPGPDTGVSMRTAGNKKNAAPSLHSFGASVDFSPKYNPYITNSNATIAKYIKHLTGFDVLGTKTAEQSYNASKLFLEKLHGKNWSYAEDLHSSVIGNYNKLGEYNNFPIDSLSNITNKDVIVSDYDNRKSGIVKYLNLCRRRIVFEDSSIEGLDILLAHLNNVSVDTIPVLNNKQVELFFSEYKSFMVKFGDLKNLATSLDENFRTVRSNRILQDGFCNIEPEVYEAFKYAHEIVSQRILGQKFILDAGITYNSSIDAMHFGLCKKLVQYLTNNQ